MKPQSDEEVDQDERRNPIKRAQKEKQIRTVGQQQEIYTDPKDMLSAVIRYDKSFKLVKNAHPKDKTTIIIDFSLNARGPQEDEIYASQSFYRNNIRRGNTLICENGDQNIHWGRKGLMKFFDISEKSIAAIIKDDINSLDRKYKNTHYAIFSQIQNALSCNVDLSEENRAKVHIYRLNKANGENAQVSYFAPKDQWLITSKNVSVLASQRAYLKLYQGDRYQFSLLIAETWFNLIQKKTKEQLQELKAVLKDKTLVGEYCGNPQYQHLVKYEHVTIFFYAVVDNHSSDTCLIPPEAFQLLERHGLPIVKNYEKAFFGKYDSFVALGECLGALFKQVAKASIFEEQEGSVVYFVLEKPKIYCEYISDHYLQKTVPIPVNFQEKQIWFKTSSLGKVKTLQYRILRKLREKLRFFSRLKNKEDNAEKNKEDQKKLQQKYGSFEKQTYHLIKHETLNKPIEYYFCIGLLAFDYVFKNRKSPRNLEALNDHYLDFLSVIFWCVENKKQVNANVMNDDELRKELRGTTWEKYGINIVNHYQELLQKIVPRFAKIKKTMKMGDSDDDKPVDQ